MVKRVKVHNIIVFITIVFIIIVVVMNIYLHYAYPAISSENLHKFYKLTKEDPLFYDPNTDTKFLDSSITQLRSLDNLILQTQRKYDKNPRQNMYLEKWNIWPEDFLAKLSPIHSITKHFLVNPTEKDARILLSTYEQAAFQYKKAIESHTVALKSILDKTPTLKKRKIVFLGSATTPEIIYNDFLLIKQNAEELEKEINLRKKCLYNGICPIPRRPLLPQKAQNLTFTPLSEDILGNGKKVGPYLVSTGCFGRESKDIVYTYPFYMITLKDKDNKTFISPIIGNTKYYEDYRGKNTIFAQVFAKRGIQLRPHFEANDYFCTDLRYLPDLYMQYLQDQKGIVNSVSQRTKISTFPYLIQHTLSFSDFMVYFTNYRKEPFGQLYLLTNRTSYSLYFGTFSPAIWRISRTPTFLIPEDFSHLIEQAGYTTYEKLRKEGYNDAELKEINNAPQNREVFLEELQKNMIK